MKSLVHFDLLLESFRIGALTIFSTHYRWIFMLKGAMLYLLTRFQYALVQGEISFFKTNSFQLNTLNFVTTAVQIAIILSMIRLILILFQVPHKGFSPLFFLDEVRGAQRWQILGIYFLKGLLLSILLIIIPGFIYGFFSMQSPLSSLHVMLLMKISFALSLTFFGFCCWLLIDQGTSLKESVIGSFWCGWHHVVCLFLFYVVAVIGMALLNIPPFLEIISYCIYFPVMLAAQGHLYRVLCRPFKTKLEHNIPLYRPPIS